MDDLNQPPAEEAADQLETQPSYNEHTGETSDPAMSSLGDLSDVDTEVDDSLDMLSPSLLAPLMQTAHDDEEDVGSTPNKLELEAENSSTDPFASLFDGLVIAGQEEKEEEGPLPEETKVEASTEPNVAPPSLLDIESIDKIESIAENQQNEAIIQVQEAPVVTITELLPEAPSPSPQSPPSPPPPLKQQHQQLPKNKVHYPDIPGASLLELAEHAESRLALGSSSSSATLNLTTIHTTGRGVVVGEQPELPVAALQSPFEKEELGNTNFHLFENIDGENTTVEEEGQMFRKQLLVARLVSQLDISSSTTTATPLPDEPTSTHTATAMGTNLAARAFLSPQLESLFKRSGGDSGGGSTAMSTSIPSVISKYLGIVAVGTVAGGVNVLVPKAGSRGPPYLHSLHDKTIVGDAVTAVALGQHAGGLLLLAGHASGQLRLWETKPVAGGGVMWVLARTVSGAHASAVTAITVIDGGTTTWALSADAHGRLMCHNVNRLLSLAAQALAGFARQWAGGGVAAAAAAASSLISLEAAGQDPGVILSLTQLGSRNSNATQQPAGHQHQSSGGGAKTLHATAEGTHFILLVATRAVLLAAFTAEGSLSILHIFFPPPAMQGETVGCAAWQLVPPAVGDALDASHQTAQHATHAVVAIAWGTSVTIYKCALTRQNKATSSSPQPSPSKSPTAAAAGGGSPSKPTATPLAPPQLLSNFSTEYPVSGLAFIGPLGALVVASAQGEVSTEIAIYHPSTFFSTTKEESVDQLSESHTVEKFIISDWMVVRQLGLPGAGSLHGSLATSSGGGGGGDQLLVLTSRGVRVIHLLTWQQRLSTLVGMQKLEVAMLAAVRLYLQATDPAAGGGGASALSSAAAGCLWPADRAAASDAEDVARQLLTILYAFVDSKLTTLTTRNHQEKDEQKEKDEEKEAEQGADIAVNTCLLLSRSEALFDEIAPKFLSSRFSSAFLTQLEPRILADELPSLAPEVMQALVEDFAHSGQLERVEKCVLKLDILSLDLNQLIPLCLRHGLYGALIHIFIGALQDYQTPATLLLVAAASTAASSSTKSTRETTAPSNKDLLENSLALQLGYRLLVYLKGCLSGLQYPPCSGHAPPQQQQAMRLHAVTFLLHVNTATLLDTWQLWASVAHLDTSESFSGNSIASSLPDVLHDPSPVLRYLCQMDAPAVLGVLSDGLKGWDALESDLVDLSPELGSVIISSNASACAGAGGRTITQAAVDAVVELLQDQELSKNEEPALLKFVAEHLAAHRASAEDAVLLRVLRFLAAAEKQEKEDLSLAERESIFKDIVVHIHGNGQNNIRTNPQVRGEALDLARSAGFRQAEAKIRHAERAFSQSFTCLVEDGTRYPLAPFQYLRDICFDPALTESDCSLVKSAALKLAPQLVRIDAGETAAVVAECFTQESHVAVLEVLAPWPDDQFAFLQAAIEGSNNNNGAVATSQQPESGGLSSTTRPLSPESALESFRGDPLFAPLLNNKGVSSLYVRLLCRFQPNDVLPFLQAHDTYNVDECLKHCIDHGAREAAAFLLERKGDVQAALKMYLEQVDVANAALVVAVKGHGVEGRVPPSYYTTATAGGGISSSKSTPQMTFPMTTTSVPFSSSAAVSTSLSPPAARTSPQTLLREFIAARDAMNSAVSMCIRFAQDRMTPVHSPVEEEDIQVAAKSSAASPTAAVFEKEKQEEDGVDFKGDPVLAVWFEVLQRYVTSIRKLRAEEKENIAASDALTTSTKTSIVSPIDRLTCLDCVFTAFMEEVISQMAGHVPLHSIAAAVLQKYSGDSFGDFRSTLSSLLGACNFELAILRCASRVTGTDTIALLKQGYKQCMMPDVVVHSDNNNTSGGGGGGNRINNLSFASGSQRSMEAALKSLESAQQIGQDAWAKAAAAAGPAANKLMEKAGFVEPPC